jgi:SPP1 family predicted phage head-tail adaptor
MNPAGRFRHRVTFEEKVSTQDSVTGEVVETWQTFRASVPAEIVYLSAREFITSAKRDSEITARITVRYFSGMLATMRIRQGTVIFNIAGALPDLNSGLEHITIPVSNGLNAG